jgi:hypothetical protein
MTPTDTVSSISNLEIELLKSLGSRFAELGYLTLERMDPGAEAKALTKIVARGEFVLKAIDETKAKEEVRHIARIEALVPGFFPRLIHSQLDAGLYAIEFVAGVPLESLLSLPLIAEAKPDLSGPLAVALQRLKHLHDTSRRPYSGSYHKVIVDHRLRSVPLCQVIGKRFAELNNVPGASAQSWSDCARSLSLTSALICTASRYARVLPTGESLIHGDPHLGNIIARKEGGVCFIDPRVTWDRIKNPRAGYFDPLYDVACVAHSIMANAIVRFTGTCDPQAVAESAMLETLQAWAHATVETYLSRRPNEAEATRFTVYLACALLGNLRYAQWTPSQRSFASTIACVSALLKDLSN